MWHVMSAKITSFVERKSNGPMVAMKTVLSFITRNMPHFLNHLEKVPRSFQNHVVLCTLEIDKLGFVDLFTGSLLWGDEAEKMKRKRGKD